MRIRYIRHEDLPKVKKILKQWMSEKDVRHYLPFITHSINGTRESKQYNNRYLVATASHEGVVAILGFRNPIPKMIQFARTKKPVELNMLYVAVHQHRKGAGTALINAMERIATTQRYKEVLVRSALRFKTTGWKFYDRLPGYTRVKLFIDPQTKNKAQVWRKVLS